MNDTPLISIIIPVFNSEIYISRCIDSIFNQTFENFEVICIDDGSTDKSGIICDEYASKDSRIKVIHKKNEGVSVARNTGLQNIKGNFVSFIDSDDWLESDFLQLLYEKITTEKADISLCGWNFVYTNGTKSCLSEIGTTKIENINLALINKGNPRVWGKLFKSDLLKNIVFNNSISIGEDSLFYIETLIKSNKIAVINKPLYNYEKRNESSAVSIMTLEKYQILKESNLMIEQLLFNNNILPQTYKYLNDRKAKSIIDAIKSLPANKWKNVFNMYPTVKCFYSNYVKYGTFKIVFLRIFGLRWIMAFLIHTHYKLKSKHFIF